MSLSNASESHRTEILEKLLEQSPFLGWTERNIQNISRGLGHSERILVRSFPNGLRDVIDRHAYLLDQRMLETIDSKDFRKLPVRARITKLVFARINTMASYREAIARLIPILSTPPYLATGTKILCRTADLMWRTAGDTSTDYNYYTKRSLLAGVYSTTLLCWLTDDSKNYCDTQAFLDRRINNVMIG